MPEDNQYLTDEQIEGFVSDLRLAAASEADVQLFSSLCSELSTAPDEEALENTKEEIVRLYSRKANDAAGASTLSGLLMGLGDSDPAAGVDADSGNTVHSENESAAQRQPAQPTAGDLPLSVAESLIKDHQNVENAVADIKGRLTPEIAENYLAADAPKRGDAVRKGLANKVDPKHWGLKILENRVAQNLANTLVTALIVAGLVRTPAPEVPAKEKPKYSQKQMDEQLATVKATFAAEKKELIVDANRKIQETADASYAIGLQDGSKTVPSVAAPFNSNRDGIIRHGEKVSFPAEHILRQPANKRLQNLEDLGNIMKEAPLSEVMTFGTDIANMNGRIVVVTDEAILQDTKSLGFVVDSLNEIKTLEGSEYDNNTLPAVTFLFNIVTDPDDATKKRVELEQVIDKDNKKVLNTLDL